jgi:hypothetical protein
MQGSNPCPVPIKKQKEEKMLIKHIKLAGVLARLWMVEHPTETDVADYIIEICKLFGEDFTHILVDYIRDEDNDFSVQGLPFENTISSLPVPIIRRNTNAVRKE